ncbi:MAG: helix-turn-helix domain-containing protein [Treponema sp.]|nr:helix-turn-helix domain-containing protein [Treponema sp.]
MSEKFADRLKSIRALRNLTQSELGEKSGLPTSSVAQFETKARKPSFDTLSKLSKALDVSTDYLLGTVDEPKISETGSVFFRNYEQLSSHDQEILQDIVNSMMARKNQKDDKTS